MEVNYLGSKEKKNKLRHIKACLTCICLIIKTNKNNPETFFSITAVADVKGVFITRTNYMLCKGIFSSGVHETNPLDVNQCLH